MSEVSAQELRDVAANLDKEIATRAPPDLLDLVKKRILTARLLELHARMEAFNRQCNAASEPTCTLLRIQAY